MSAPNRPRVLLVHNKRTSFVAHDHACLAEACEVTELTMSRAKLNPFALAAAVRRHDLVFGWFASWHTWPLMALAQHYRVPSLLIIGGYDLANLPAIGYGHQRGGFRKVLARNTMRLADRLVTNAGFSRREARDNAGLDPEKVHVVYHGVPDPFAIISPKGDKPIALTVGNVDRPNLWRKGLQPFVAAARACPEVEFRLVGDWKDDAIDLLRAEASPNLVFTGRVSDADLLQHYRDAHVYLQLSAHEGFGMSLAEAMLGGAIPVVTRAGAIPEVVGDTGLYVDDLAPDIVAWQIRLALQKNDAARAMTRNRILSEFPLSRRRDGLLQHVSALLNRDVRPQ